MADNLDIAVRIRADLQSALNNLRKMEGGVKGMGAEMRRTSGAAGILGTNIRQLVAGDLIARAFTNMARSAKRLAVEVVAAGTNMESLAASMRSAVGGDAALAAQELSFVAREAERLGIDLPAAEQGFVKLSAAARGTSLEGTAAREIFIGIAEAARAMGLSTEQQSGALIAIEQIISKGTVSAEELRGQLGDRLPGAFQIAARAVGVTTKELGRMLARGEVLSEDFLPRFARELRATFGAGAIDQAAGPAAAFTRLDNAVLELKRTIAGSGITDFFAGLADTITDMVAAIRRGGEELGLLDAGAPLNAEDRQIRIAAAQDDYAHAASQILRIEAKIEEVRSRLRTDQPESTSATLSKALESLIRFRAEQISARQDAVATLGRLGRPAEGGTSRRPRSSSAESADPATAPPDGTAGQQSTAARKAEQLRRQIIATRALTIEDRIREEIQAGLIEGSKAEVGRLIEQARELDRINAASDERRKLDDEARRAEEARTAALRDAATLNAELAAAAADLEGPYEAALHAAEAWRAEQERTLAGLAEQGHATEEMGEVVVDVYLHRIAAAAREAADEEAAAAEDRLRNATDFRSGVERALRDLKAETEDYAAIAERGIRSAFRSAGDAIEEFVRTGKLSFGGLVEDILAGLARIQVERALVGLLDLIPIPTAGSGLFGIGTGNVHLPPTALDHAGGIAGALGGLRRSGVPALAFAGAPRLHGGGLPGLRSNEIPTIIERGEGVFTRGQMAALAPAAAPEITINIENRGTPQQARPAQTQFDGRGWIVGVMLNDFEQNGPVSQGLQQRFALSPRV